MSGIAEGEIGRLLREQLGMTGVQQVQQFTGQVGDGGDRREVRVTITQAVHVNREGKQPVAVVVEDAGRRSEASGNTLYQALRSLSRAASSKEAPLTRRSTPDGRRRRSLPMAAYR